MATTNSESKQFNKNLKYSIVDGSAHAAMLGLTQDYIVPFALALKATTAQVGLLTSVPNLAMALSQLAAPLLTEIAGNRKKIILPAVMLHAFMWMPVLLTAFVPPGLRIACLIANYTFTVVLGALGNPAWGSMMADIVPQRIRGRYFGFRARICNLATLVFSFIAGGTLQFFTANIMTGFTLLFGGATLFRLISWRFLSKMHEPPMIIQDSPNYHPFTLLKNIGATNLGRFIILIALINLTTNIASPFFAVYMLRDLKFSYGTYVIITAAATLSNLIFLTFWGRRADRAGNIAVLRITAMLVPVIPLMWLGGSHFYYLIFVQIVSGFAWSGFNLVSTNFLYGATPPEKRTQYIAIFNALNGGAICFGAIIGGFLASHLPAILGYRMLTLFTVSGVLRFFAAAILLPRINEVRTVPLTSTPELLIGQLTTAGKRAWKVPRMVRYPLSTLGIDRMSSTINLRKELRGAPGNELRRPENVTKIEKAKSKGLLMIQKTPSSTDKH
ncbi:MAG: MFS transporter [Dehalococcoidales bacterium]|nr:MFS transporter [Dehalococcoidales bacterium]